MKTIDCSFCGKTAPTEVTPGKMVSGKEVNICRDCVELMVESFARKDQRWRDRTLLSLRTVQAMGK